MQNPDELNSHFASTAERTLNRSATPIEDIFTTISNLPPDKENYFNLRQVSNQEVLKQLKSLRRDTSTGPDNIPARYIKLAVDIICSSLTHIINSFINESTFPILWKNARIVPIGKIASPIEKGDFRPISILPVLDKIFERLVANQLVDFIEETKLFRDTITGFRKGHSTGNALLKIRDDIKKAMKCGELSLLVFVDFSKAFELRLLINTHPEMHQQRVFPKNSLHG
eukprot:Seg5240.1 transcript_id=Seg5240.1/GoldUCD/mRNA.D3Y31 product="RNA-directed DNA polymerase from mobile element jockey" protein_id=Seg5240.1/GoldUCD/D3Y31